MASSRSIVERDGRTWRIGTQADVAWVREGTAPGLTIASAIPLRYDGYATATVADTDVERRSDEATLVRRERLARPSTGPDLPR